MAFIRTSPFRKNDPQYSAYQIRPLQSPSNDTLVIANTALAILKAIYKPGFRYAKAGVMLLDLQPEALQQFTLELGDDLIRDRKALMETLDDLNHRFGRGTLKLGANVIGHEFRNWRMKQTRRTPAYTTNWESLVIAR